MGLYPHQIQALTETEAFNNVGYFLDMGLGKTYVGAEKMKTLQRPVNLVVCQKSKVQDWIDHFTTCGFQTIWDCTAWKLDDWFNWTLYPDTPCVMVINYDLIFRRPELLKLQNFTLMLDESSVITNPTTKRTKFIHKLKPDNCILLSGTPTGGKYEKLWSQLRLIGWNISKNAFWKQYVETEWIEDDSGFKIEIVTGYKNVERLKAKLKQYGCIFMKTEEVFDLPEMIMVPVMVSTTRPYRQFMKNSIVTLDDEIELIGDTKLTKRMYARQLCGQYNQSKLTAFKDLVESTDDRLIVFYNFNDEVAKMLEIVHDLEKPVSFVNGHIKDLEEYDTKTDSVTFVQYQAGAMGLNLQKANKVIYFTLPQSADLFEQSKKRIHRIGQAKNCFYYLLMCLNSIEEDILETLKRRKDYDDVLFEKYEAQTR